MPKMTKAQAKKRLLEAQRKIMAVYTNKLNYQPNIIVYTKDMEAFEKIFNRCINRVK